MIAPLYSKQEVMDRAQFHRFIHTFFKLTKKGSGDFPKGLSLEFVYNMFNTFMEGKHQLTESTMESLIMLGGFTEEDAEALLWVTLNFDTYLTLPTAIQYKLSLMANASVSLKMRQLVLGINADAYEVPQLSYFKLFVKYYTFTNNHKYFYRFIESYGRSTLAEVYAYYQQFCYKYNTLPLTKGEVRKQLESLGYDTYKGYAKKQCGVILVNKLFVPMFNHDMQEAFDMYCGVCTIPGSGHQVTTTGHILQDMTPTGKQALINNNKKESAYYEQGTEENEKAFGQAKEAEAIDWPEIEGAEAPVGGGPEISQPEESPRDDAGSIKESKKANKRNVRNGGHSVATDDDVKSTSKAKSTGKAGIAYPNSDTILESQDAELGGSSDTDPEIRYADFPEPKLIDSGITDSSSGTIEETGGDVEPITEEEPTIHDVARALLVPYNMNPATFDIETMKHYVSIMHLNFVVDEEWYDILIDNIKEMRGEK